MAEHLMTIGPLVNAVIVDDTVDDFIKVDTAGDDEVFLSSGGQGSFFPVSITASGTFLTTLSPWADNELGRWHGSSAGSAVFQGSSIFVDDSQNMTGLNDVTMGGNLLVTDGDSTVAVGNILVSAGDVFVEVGSVGIGTTSPESALDVRGPAGSGTASAGVITVSSDELTLVDGDYIGRYDFNASIPAIVGDTPDTSYDTQSVTAGANLTDFTLLVNLANLTAAWRAEVDTSDGTRGRVFKDDLTELAVDWISFVNGGGGAVTGWIRIKWSGTLSGAGANTIRIYPPVAANSSVAAGDTYGAFNAYDANWAAYYPMGDASGGITDQTRNGADLAEVGSPTYGAAGQVGDAITLGAGDNFESIVTTITDNPATIMAWGNADDVATFYVLGGVADGSTPNNYLYLIMAGSDAGDPMQGIQFGPNGAKIVNSSSGFSAGTWHHGAVRFISDVNRFAYLDGANEGQSTDDSGATSGVDTTSIGITADSTPLGNFHGSLQEFQLHSVDRGADWIAEEVAATKNNLTYWGTWNNVPFGGSPPARKVVASIHAEASDTFANEVTSTDIVFSTGTITSATEKMRLGAIGTLGLGVVPLANMAAGMMVLEGGAIVLKEITTPTPDTNYGKIYPKSDNVLYFQDGAGVEHSIGLLGLGAIDISDDTNLAVTSPIVLTDDTLSHAVSGVGAGTYTSVTVNTLGHVTGATNPSHILGSGTQDTIPLWTPDGNTLGDSALTQSGGSVSASGGFTATGNLTSTDGTIIGLSTISAGVTLQSLITNGDDTNVASHAQFRAQTEDSGGGDPYSEWKIAVVNQSYVLGIDNSDSDKFVGSVGTALGTSNWLEVTTAGDILLTGDTTISQDLTITTGNLQVTAGDISILSGTLIVVIPTGIAATISRNVNTTTAPVVKIVQDNASAGGPVLELQQDTDFDAFVVFTGSDRGVISSGASSLKSIRVEHNGTLYLVPLYADA